MSEAGRHGGLDALTGRIEDRELTTEMRSSYLDYAMSVIVGRALPDVRDGLKPVHRRVLYAMHDLGLQPNRGYRKCAFIVGEVMGKYHPHGDSAIYDTLVRLAQDFALRSPLVDGQGNFGSIDDDPAAAMRYTEARLERLATEMLRDIDADTVDFGPNYDETSSEPLVLPSRFPNLLVNGSTGIAVGMATNIPPHNLGEVIQATKAYIANPSIDLQGLMEYVKGPDFPGGGMMSGSGIRDAYASGRGSVRIRARAHVEPIRGGKDAIIVSELPYMVKKGGEGGLITKIADLVREKKITGISDLRDESDRSGMRLVIELKRGGDPAAVVLNQLYKHTPMQNSFGMNMVSLVNGVPRTLGLKEMIHHYVDHQRDVIVRRTQYELRQAEARAHVLEGLLIALDNLDAVIALIRGSADPVEAKDGLIEQLRALGHPGAGDPGHAPPAPHRARVRQDPRRARRAHGQDRRAPRDPGRPIPHRRPDRRRALRDRGQVRRRAAHRAHALRWRPQHRGRHRRPADGRLAHQLRLREAPAARHLPPAAPRRHRGDGDEPEGGGLHRAPPHLLDPRLPPLLHQPRQGLPPQGLRAARGLAHP